MGAVASLVEYRNARLYREQFALWRSRGVGPAVCHLIAAHVCRGEFVGRISPPASGRWTRACGKSHVSPPARTTGAPLGPKGLRCGR